jgi:hypothetical protein
LPKRDHKAARRAEPGGADAAEPAARTPSGRGADASHPPARPQPSGAHPAARTPRKSYRGACGRAVSVVAAAPSALTLARSV